MILDIEFDILPPSVNQLYRKNSHGFIYVTPKIVEFKKFVKNELSKLNLKPSIKKIRLDIVFDIKGKRNRDIDNMLKVLLDSFNKLVFEDDSQVFELHVKTNIDTKNNFTYIKAFEIDDIIEIK
jgi:Holliday junction resolvase RusA-like endonuclease